MFQGFSNRTVDFLWSVRFNNNREWLAEHKQEYLEDVQQPMRLLAAQVYEELCRRNPQMQLSLHISRIYRDARRLHGRGPLKDNLWFSIFGTREERCLGPEFFFEIMPEGYSYGLGVWSANAAAIKQYASDILAQKREIVSLAQKLSAQSAIRLCGENYKRTRGETTPLLQSWLQKKQVYFSCEQSYDEICFSAQLVQELTEGFTFLLPFYRYFDQLCRGTDGYEKL